MSKLDFTFSFPLNNGKIPLGELIISGTCWQGEVGSVDCYQMEPYGFDINKVSYREDARVNAHDVTGLYEYLLSGTLDGAQAFEEATAQHVESVLSGAFKVTLYEPKIAA